MSTSPSFIPNGPLVQRPRVPRKRHPVRTALLAGGVLLVLSVGVTYIVQPKFPALIARLVQQPFIPSELKAARFIKDGETETVEVRMQGPTVFTAQAFSGVLESMDTRAAYAEVVRLDGRYLVRTAKDTVYTDTHALSGVTRSPDGRYIVVARQGTTTDTRVPHPSGWSLVLIDTVQKTTRELGSGVAPLFSDGTRLVYIRSSDMVAYDVVKGTEKILSDHVFEGTGFGGFSSDDRLRMGWVDTTRKEITIYKVDTGNAEVVAIVPTTDTDLSYALGKEGIYVLRKGAGGETEIWYGRHGAPITRILTLPSQLGVTRIGMGAI